MIIIIAAPGILERVVHSGGGGALTGTEKYVLSAFFSLSINSRKKMGH